MTLTAYPGLDPRLELDTLLSYHVLENTLTTIQNVRSRTTCKIILLYCKTRIIRYYTLTRLSLEWPAHIVSHAEIAQ